MSMAVCAAIRLSLVPVYLLTYILKIPEYISTHTQPVHRVAAIEELLLRWQINNSWKTVRNSFWNCCSCKQLWESFESISGQNQAGALYDLQQWFQLTCWILLWDKLQALTWTSLYGKQTSPWVYTAMEGFRQQQLRSDLGKQTLLCQLVFVSTLLWSSSCNLTLISSSSPSTATILFHVNKHVPCWGTW